MQIRAARPSEYDEAVELVDAAFDRDDPATAIVTASLRHDARFVPQLLRVAVDGGRVVGTVNLIDRVVRFGAGLVRCAIVAPVAVTADERGAGIGSALMRDSLEWARGAGFELSMLWGHTWLYPRYGYAPGIKSYAVRMASHAAPFGASAYSLRPYGVGDVSALVQVYHAETAGATLAELRSAEPWQWRPRDPLTVVEVAVDPAGAVRGYLRATPGATELEVGELYAMDAGAAAALHDRLLYLAREANLAEIVVRATPENRWSRLAFGAGAQLCVGSGGGAGMVRVLDWLAFLRAIQPELERRVRRSELVVGQAAVQFETPVGRGTVEVDGGSVTISAAQAASAVLLPFHGLGPLVTGYQPLGQLAGLAGVFVRGAATERLVDVLFPEGFPHWSFAAYLG